MSKKILICVLLNWAKKNIKKLFSFEICDKKFYLRKKFAKIFIALTFFTVAALASPTFFATLEIYDSLKSARDQLKGCQNIQAFKTIHEQSGLYLL